ncbi:hypothetical protein R3P38DRAFT_2758932 [Favolaschia claudopus]|uniref:Uncharacterized protein n=1 Tax=Favolaschia claudopus TaxID=2862362 RepID=A0AAW0E4Z6_9AGAR
MDRLRVENSSRTTTSSRTSARMAPFMQKKPMTHDHAQELINKFALGAKINKTFTTHCLRRGGSQYRFMFAPIGKRWSLSIIRWWGGWAVGEQSFMGEHNALQPPSTAEFRLFGSQILTKLDGIVSRVQNAGQPSRIATQQLTDLAVLMQQASVSSRITVSTSSSVNHTSAPYHDPLEQTNPDSHSTPTLPSATPTASFSSASSWSDENDSTSFVPISGAIIPGVGKDSQAWKRAIDQWYHGDPAQGLRVALKDWPLNIELAHRKDAFEDRDTLL